MLGRREIDFERSEMFFFPPIHFARVVDLVALKNVEITFRNQDTRMIAFRQFFYRRQIQVVVMIVLIRTRLILGSSSKAIPGWRARFGPAKRKGLTLFDQTGSVKIFRPGN